MAFWRRRELDAAAIAAVASQVRALADGGDRDAAWDAAQPLCAAPQAAITVARLLRCFDRVRALTLAKALLVDHPRDLAVIAALGKACSHLTDIDDLNAAPPDDPWFAALVARLDALAATATDPDERVSLLASLAAAARRLGRSGDAITERAHQQHLALRGDDWEAHFNQGLFFKTRGRFVHGQRANQRAADLGGADDQATRWNLGVCATGAGDGPTALRIWKQLGQRVELGRFDLPDGRYPHAKVRVAERPLAERGGADAPDDPGCEENIWVERLSPCHGIIRCALYHADEIGLDFGDVVLFDGAPIGYERRGDEPAPIFPHLATLVRRRFQIFRFGGTQARPGQLGELSDGLPAETVVYSHTENTVILCGECARGRNDAPHEHRTSDHRIVTGKICAPPTLAPADLRAALDRAVAAAPGAQLYCPDLTAAAGDHARATVERRRLADLTAPP